MRREYDSYDSRDGSRYDSSDASPRAPKPSAAMGWVALSFTLASFVGLLGCFGCISWAEGLRGASQGETLVLFPLLLLAFIVCAAISLGTGLVAVIVGIIGLFQARGRGLAIAALANMLVWAGGVWWMVDWIMKSK